jgi:hypothetical protein
MKGSRRRVSRPAAPSSRSVLAGWRSGTEAMSPTPATEIMVAVCRAMVVSQGTV